jgi:solute carrier family 12 (sodium/potassium/chloride transporter), member 2
MNDTAAEKTGFGTFAGVFTPSILTILGVILYLRVGWVVGNVGLLGALLIVGLAHLISLTTGFSVASIATNRTVRTGGAYFMISRSLGPAAGAALGIPLYLAQAISVTFYIIGFTESLSQLAPSLDPRILGSVTCVALGLISYRSAATAIRVQYFVMAAIGLSLVSIFMGGSPNPPAGISWWNTGGASFAEVFAVFFPAVTGIMAGVSLSGDLKDPRRSLPIGTIAAILVGMVIYVSLPIWLALNYDSQTLTSRLDVVWLVSRIPALIYVGIWGATLSSALGSFLAAPRTLQALARDRIGFSIFARGHGPNNEPRLGLILTFVLAEAGILLGSLDMIAPILTMFFLATYGVTNLAFGLEEWASSPNFRPAFRVPSWVGLLGALACFYVMSIINLLAMLVALLICLGIYLTAKRRLLDTTYGDARHGLWSALVLTSLQQLRRTRFHGLNWRPHLVVLAGNLAKRSYLLELGSAIVQDRGMVTYLHLLKGTVAQEASRRREILKVLEHQFIEDYPHVFCRVDIVDDVYRGAVSSVMGQGLGVMEPNTVILGWLTKPERAGAYARMLGDLLNLDRSLLVVHFDPERGYGMGRRIDIWWRGLRSNGALMLMLAFLLNSHERFHHASIRVITAVEEERQQSEAEARLQDILLKSRLDITSRVLLRNHRPIHEIMREESRESDLALVGLQLPRSPEEAAGFVEQYARILESLPTTILVGSAPSFVGTPVLFDEE